MGLVLPRGVRANPGKLVSVRKTHTSGVRRAGVTTENSSPSAGPSAGLEGTVMLGEERTFSRLVRGYITSLTELVQRLPTMMPGVGLAPGHS